jgi:CubicO group peptidase (beta-lactamase class C family)
MPCEGALPDARRRTLTGGSYPSRCTFINSAAAGRRWPADRSAAWVPWVDDRAGAFANGPDSDGVVHAKGERSYRAQWWVKHTKGMEASMAIGIHGQWIHLDVERGIAIVEQSSQPVSKDEYLNSYDLNAFDAIVRHVSGR